jgi:hypothetical protein
MNNYVCLGADEPISQLQTRIHMYILSGTKKTIELSSNG